MNYWWVNQNQTYRQEVAGGYLWSPKRNANNHRNPFYEYMRRVVPGDIVFSFSDTLIKAIGIVQSTAYGFPKPEEFVDVGANWSDFGWKVDVSYHEVTNAIRPKHHIDQLRHLLPGKYSPLRQTGDGLQGVYLTKVPDALADALVSLIGEEATSLLRALRGINYPQSGDLIMVPFDGVSMLEEKQIEALSRDTSLSDTERLALVLSRRGQGAFRQNVATLESSCRITEVSRPEYLIASHIKPWRYCESAEERLAATNGLFLTPTADHLFDHGYISFDDNGELLVSPVADPFSLESMGIEIDHHHARSFNVDQRHFLDYHRREVFLEPDLGVGNTSDSAR